MFHEFRLLRKIWKERGFSVIQACNPPDLIFLVALPFKLLGVRFVYDQHDLVPLLFLVKFGREGLLYRALSFFEKMTLHFADFAFFSNDTFREIAIERGYITATKSASVYSIPNRELIYRTEPDETLRKARRFVIGYVGIIGAQDGVDQLVHAAAHILHTEGYSDFQVVVVGDGPAMEHVIALAKELGVETHFSFVGYQVGDMLQKYLSSFDVAVVPDPVNSANDKMSMNKVFEYSMLGLAIASYPLRETKRLLGDAAVYAETADPEGLGRACLRLIRDDDLRRRCGAAAQNLADTAFLWDRESAKYVEAYEKLQSGSCSSFAVQSSHLQRAHD